MKRWTLVLFMVARTKLSNKFFNNNIISIPATIQQLFFFFVSLYVILRDYIYLTDDLQWEHEDKQN